MIYLGIESLCYGSMKYGSRWVQLQVEIVRKGDLPNNVIIVLTYVLASKNTRRYTQLTHYKWYIVI